ncbi:MAG: hypothetical protein AB1489_29910 [Acidobacteriota bacterium]
MRVSNKTPLLIIFIFSLLGSVTEVNAQTKKKIDKPTGIAILYSLDPLSQTFCFNDAQPGHMFQDFQVKNRCSDIDFEQYHKGCFTVGIEGGRKGNIIDLGMADELQTKYKYTETVGNGQGYASIRYSNGKILILKDYDSQGLQELKEAEALFSQTSKNPFAAIKAGHIYLLRIDDSSEPDFSLMVKLLVLSYIPGESVTFRWQIL